MTTKDASIAHRNVFCDYALRREERRGIIFRKQNDRRIPLPSRQKSRNSGRCQRRRSGGKETTIDESSKPMGLWQKHHPSSGETRERGSNYALKREGIENAGDTLVQEEILGGRESVRLKFPERKQRKRIREAENGVKEALRDARPLNEARRERGVRF